MNNLTIINQDGQLLVDSRQVAEMVGKEHSHLLRDIKGYISILGPNPKVDSAQFFIESTYIDKQNQARACYLITKMGCEMVANKLTGEKGVLFTAAYVTKFNQMEQQTPPKITRTRQSTPRVKPAVKDALDTAEYISKKLGVKPGIAQAAAISMVEKTTGLELAPLKKLLPPAEHETGFLNPTEIGKRIGMKAANVNLLLVERGLQVKQGTDWRLTDTGKKYAEEMPYNKNGHSGYQIQWNELVVEALRQTA